eukprot:241548-Rhodomonas_salina.1
MSRPMAPTAPTHLPAAGRAHEHQTSHSRDTRSHRRAASSVPSICSCTHPFRAWCVRAAVAPTSDSLR